ncbi:uncharacterized protein LOC134855671 [Symsagittifera roscoffensis]|uniref:uncharacterized protein LOC134855671 n=1 Tax=Symsagittifera roscoffensis TaxID=84072 RepID=UPI00307C6FF2
MSQFYISSVTSYLPIFVVVLLSTWISNISSQDMTGARIGSVKLYDPPAADPDGLTMGLVQATFVVGTENQSNWWPVCEMPIDVAEKVCDMVLPATYSVFVGGSTLVARDILGVAYCLDITCPQNETVPLTECQISLSDQQVMTSYLICLDEPTNRECWITDSNMPMYCVEPVRYERVSNVMSYLGFAVAVFSVFAVMCGFLAADANRIIQLNKLDSSGGRNKQSLIGMNKHGSTTAN